MIWLYRIAFLPALCITLPYYLLRMWRRGGYRDGFKYRLGAFGDMPQRKKGVRRLWVQAVSVGEILALEPLLKTWSSRPDIEVVLTTTTSTGLKLARQKFDAQCLLTAVFPLDFWPFSARAWHHIQPDAILLMEGELWPEHLHQAALHNVPAILLNARMSDRSFRRYLKLAPLARPLLRPLTRILAATDQDALRFQMIVGHNVPVITCGSLKFDVDFGEPMHTKIRQKWLFELGFQPPEPVSPAQPPLVVLGSSTWPGEERLLLDLLQQARVQGLPVFVLLCPRHAERRQEISAILDNSPWRYHLRSQGKAASYPTDVYIADTTGELRQLTQLADLVFIGKTLPPHHQGQTPIEAAAFAKPMITGPKLTNFSDISKQLQQNGIAEALPDAEAITKRMLELLTQPQLRETKARAARTWFPTNRGAAKRTLQSIDEVLGQPLP